MGLLSAFALFIVFGFGGMIAAAESKSPYSRFVSLMSRAQLNEVIHKVRCHAG